MGSKKLVSEWRNLTYVVAWAWISRKGLTLTGFFRKFRSYPGLTSLRKNWMHLPQDRTEFSLTLDTSFFSELLVAYAYPFIYSKTKANTLVLQNLFVFVFVIKDIDLNSKPHMRNQNMAQLANWTSVVLWTKTCFSDIKTWTFRLFWCTTSLP